MSMPSGAAETSGEEAMAHVPFSEHSRSLSQFLEIPLRDNGVFALVPLALVQDEHNICLFEGFFDFHGAGDKPIAQECQAENFSKAILDQEFVELAVEVGLVRQIDVHRSGTWAVIAELVRVHFVITKHPASGLNLSP
jgi:hypothetical protein